MTKQYKGFTLKKITRNTILIYDANGALVDTSAYCKKNFPYTWKEAKNIIDTKLSK